MNAPAKLTAFGTALGLLFAGGALAGDAIGPEPDSSAVAASSRAPAPGTRAHESESEGAHAGMHVGSAHPVRGLSVAVNGLRVVVDDPELRRDRAEELRFRVVADDGTAVRDFDVQHTKRMHLIVARRDLTGFQHLHPALRSDGTWVTALRVETAGSYRLFADFAHEGEPYTLASDLRVDGNSDLKPLPAPQAIATSDDGYDVRLDAGRARPGREADLRFTVSREGRPVQTEPYLGAGGHLVALREGDLAFLHVHPTVHDDEVETTDENSIGFAATFPTAGRYRLFLQFKQAGRVQTVSFTQEVK